MEYRSLALALRALRHLSRNRNFERFNSGLGRRALRLGKIFDAVANDLRDPGAGRVVLEPAAPDVPEPLALCYEIPKLGYRRSIYLTADEAAILVEELERAGITVGSARGVR